MREERIPISVSVTSKSVQESNLILRKLFEELRENAPLGWQFMPERAGNDIFIGFCNYGQMYLHYKQKGKIDRITFLTSDKRDIPIIENAIKKANDDHNTFIDYSLKAAFTVDTIVFREMAKYQIYAVGEEGRDSCNHLNVTFGVKAFGDNDVQYIASQKMNYLRLLLSVYTNCVFEKPKLTISRGKQDIPDINWSNYDEDWIDCFYEYSGINEAVLLPDFFALFHHVIELDYYDKNFRLLLNAAQDYFCALLMKERLVENGNDGIPGIVDAINTMLISTLEPLSNINREAPPTCPECGNTVYKISAHVRSLCEKYLGEHIAKDIVTRGYKNRSSFLHEGKARTNEFFCGKCVPQLDLNSLNELVWPVPLLEMNYFDYTSYVFRRVSHDLLMDPSSFDETPI